MVHFGAKSQSHPVAHDCAGPWRQECAARAQESKANIVGTKTTGQRLQVSGGKTKPEVRDSWNFKNSHPEGIQLLSWGPAPATSAPPAKELAW